MRERLIELLKEADEHSAGKCITSYDEVVACDADFLISNGVIILPCKVGDTVYQPSYKFTKCSAHDYAPRYYDDSFCCGCESDCDSVEKPYIHKGKVCKIAITTGQIYLAVAFEEKFDSSSHILGKTVFLTREEAEKAISERKKHDQNRTHRSF